MDHPSPPLRRCMHLAESASDGEGCRRRTPRREKERVDAEEEEEEEMIGSQTLSRERVRGDETETEAVRAPGGCTLFRVSARERGI